MKKKKNNKDKEDMGKWSLPTRWSEVTLGQFARLEKLYKGAASEGYIDNIDIISILSGRERDDVMALPLEFISTMQTHLVFLELEPEVGGASNVIEYEGEIYQVNYKEDLTFGEYIDADTILKKDPTNYPAILAIICRKEGEAYDSDFVANVYPKRVEMFDQMSVLKVLPVVSFFLSRWALLERCSHVYSAIKEAASLTVSNLQTSATSGLGKGLRSYLLTRKFKKLQKLLDSV
jgi:hypothetical protein